MNLRIEIGKPKTDGTCKAYILIGSCKDKQRIPTNVMLYQGEFKKTSNGVKILTFEKEFALNKILMELRSDMMNNPTLALAGNNVGASRVKSLLLDKMVSSDFFAFADEWISTCRLKGKKNYVTTINSFKVWLNRDRISFEELTPALLMRYQNSLRDRPRAQSMYMAALRKLWNEAERIYDDELPRNPFRKIDIVKQQPKGQRATDIATIHKILNYKGTSKRAILARDGFILSFCLMGMNSVDMYECTSLKGDTLAYDRAKVKERRRDNAHTEVNIHPFIKGLIKKYLDRSKGKYVFRFHDMYCSYADFNRAMNLGLKTILGENTEVTFYSARHAWATIARNDIGADKGTVNDALVHVDREMSVTDLYIKKDFRLINELNTKVIAFVFSEYMK